MKQTKLFITMSMLILLLFSSSLFSQKEDLLKKKITEFNSETVSIFLFQSYYSMDILQRESYVCKCIENSYSIEVLKQIKKSYRIIAASLVELEKLSDSKSDLRKEIRETLNIMGILKKDISLFETYLESEREKDYREFLENHKQYWNLLNTLKVNKKLNKK